MGFRLEFDEQIAKSCLCENVFASVLKYKSKAFLTSFNVQLLYHSSTNIYVSDGHKIMSLKLYSYLFELDLLHSNNIITINEIKRSSRFNLFVDNLSFSKDNQAGCQIGNPRTFCM